MLADYYREKEMWQHCYSACQAAIARERMRPSKVGHWGDDPRLKTSWLHDTAASAAWMMWDFEASYGHAVEAYRRNPDESRRKIVLNVQTHIATGATLENMPPPTKKDMPELEIEIHRRANAEEVSIEKLIPKKAKRVVADRLAAES